MAIKLGINGFGRIGSIALRIALQQPEVFDVVAIAKREADIDYMLYMIKYDTVYGRFPGKLEKAEDGIIIDGKKVLVYSEGDASKIPWKELGAEYIIDATGAYVKSEDAKAHFVGGAKKVIMSAPAKDKVTPTFVYGVNQEKYDSSMDIVSAASCTTNCLAPLCKVLQNEYGIDGGLMSTIHAATAKQKVVDAKSLKDWRTGRSVFGNIIPTATGAAKAVGLVIPEIQGKLTGIAYRVPIADVSVIDLNVKLEKPTHYADICEKVKKASETYMKGVIEYVDDEVVSSDFIGASTPTCFDARQGIEMNEYWFKLVAFYDNEWGYTANMLRLIAHMASVDAK